MNYKRDPLLKCLVRVVLELDELEELESDDLLLEDFGFELDLLLLGFELLDDEWDEERDFATAKSRFAAPTVVNINEVDKKYTYYFFQCFLFHTISS